MKDEFGFQVDVPPNYQISGKADAAQRKQEGLSLSDFGQHAQAVESAANPPSCKSVLLSAPAACSGVRSMPLKIQLPDFKAVADAASAAQPLPKAAQLPCGYIGNRFVRYVPVAFVALDWKVSARRIRVLLAEFRLEGRRDSNGYWEVAYPYRFTFGQRGPALKRTKKPEAIPDPL